MQEDKDQLPEYANGILSLKAIDKNGNAIFEYRESLKNCHRGVLLNTGGRRLADEFYPTREGKIVASISSDTINKQPEILLIVNYEPAPKTADMPERLIGSIHAFGG